MYEYGYVYIYMEGSMSVCIGQSRGIVRVLKEKAGRGSIISSLPSSVGRARGS